MATGDQTDITGRLQQLSPHGWFNSGQVPLRDALLAGLANAHAFVYSLLAYITLQTRILTASDSFLDLIAGDFFGNGQQRATNQSDSSYRAQILINMFRERATRKGLIAVLTQLTGRAPVVIEVTRPADTGAYGAAVAVTRNSIASYYDSTGVLRYAPANQVRYTYNPSNLSGSPSLLIEGASTNFLLYSLNPNLWGSFTEGTSAGTITVVSDPVFGNVVRITKTAGASTDRFGLSLSSVTGLSGSTYAISVWARPVVLGGACQPLYVDAAKVGGGLVTTSVTLSGSAGVWSYYTNNTVGSLAGTANAYVLASGPIGTTIDIAFPQLELGLVSTSFIPTGNAAVSRAADTLLNNMPGGSGALGGYGSAGAYGSLLLPNQAFVKAYRPLTAGIPIIAGYGISTAAYTTPSQGGEYATIASVVGAVADATIYAAIDSVKPAASTMWTQISS